MKTVEKLYIRKNDVKKWNEIIAPPFSSTGQVTWRRPGLVFR